MKLTILGSGTDASNVPGVPNRYPPGFLIKTNEGIHILFECSEGVRFRLQQAGVDHAELMHLAVTHSHPDHYCLPQLYQSIHNTRMWSGRYEVPHQLNLYCPKQIAEGFMDLWRLYSPNWPEGLPLLKLNFTVLPCADPVRIGNSRLLGLRVYHGNPKIEALAFRLESPDGVFTYSGDTVLCEGIRQAAQGATVFVCEASARVGRHRHELSGVHMSPYVAGLVAKEAKVRTLVLFHYTGLDTEEAVIEDCRNSGYQAEIVLGKDFQEFHI